MSRSRKLAHNGATLTCAYESIAMCPLNGSRLNGHGNFCDVAPEKILSGLCALARNVGCIVWCIIYLKFAPDLTPAPFIYLLISIIVIF